MFDNFKNKVKGSKFIDEIDPNILVENKRDFNASLKYYYEDPKDRKDVEEGGLNLSNKPRPWYSFEKTIDNKQVLVEGRQAFNDALLYKPILMTEYIRKYFIDPFESKGKKSPFKFYEQTRPKTLGFELGPQQKFSGQFISYQTDFPGLLFFQGLGSGKTATAIQAAQAMASKFIDDQGEVRPIKGREVILGTKSKKNYCPVTILVPKNIIEQYKNEIIGQIQDGQVKSATSSCVLYFENSDSDVNEYRQIYVGTVDKITEKNGHQKVTYKCKEIEELKELEEKLKEQREQLEQVSNLYNKLEFATENNEPIDKILKNELLSGVKSNQIIFLQNKITSIRSSIKELENKKKGFTKKLDDKIQDIYFIVSFDTFINKLRKKIDDFSPDKKKAKYEPSEYVAEGIPQKLKSTDDAYIGNIPHPDCFHSDSLIIIDEIHRNSSEDASMYTTLYNTLYIYCRNLINGEHTMTVGLLTATPIFDVPFQMAQTINLLRPRIPFPTKEKKHDELFIDRRKNEIKNKLLYKYLLSGYVSYFKGGNPNAYPYRRNHIKLHVMSSQQINKYIMCLVSDLKSKSKKKGDESKYNNDSSGQFAKTIGSMSCVFDGDDKYSGEEDDRVFDLGNELINMNNPEQIRRKFRIHSAKLTWSGDKIMDSSTKEEGPIFVHASLITRGIIPLVFYLLANGYTLLNDQELEKNNSQLKKYNKKTFGIWSPGAFELLKKKGYFRKSADYKEYTSMLHKRVNDFENHDGSLCKAIIGNIQEGVSFMNFSAVILQASWWNVSRNEQIIGRVIRFYSHAMLPPNRQYVDVYYNCNILPEYPHRSEKIFDYLKEELKDKDQSYSWGGLNLASCTFDQCMYNTAKNKQKLNIQFENAAKESAIDYELNKSGNMVRLEEFVYDELLNYDKGSKVSDHVKKNDIENTLYAPIKNQKIFYNRSLDQYYILKNNKLLKIDLVYKFDEIINREKLGQEDIKYSTLIWPAYDFKTQEQEEDVVINNLGNDTLGRNMVSLNMIEKINSDLLNKKINNKNFFELMEYAISIGEEKSAWDEINSERLKNNAINIIIPLFNLQRKMDEYKLEEIRNICRSIKDDKIWYAKDKMSDEKTDKINLIIGMNLKKEVLFEKIEKIIDKKIDRNEPDIKEALSIFSSNELKKIFNSLQKKKKKS